MREPSASRGTPPRRLSVSIFLGSTREEDRRQGEPNRSLATAAQEGKFEVEAWRVRKDGTRFWAHVIIDALRDDSGQLQGFAKITRDITERKEDQEALERAREALFQSQKTEAIGRLTGGIAHDFNNLLMAVLGSLELLRKRLPNDDKMRALLKTQCRVRNVVRRLRRGCCRSRGDRRLSLSLLRWWVS